MSSQPMERCENCFKQFPQSKIHSHFSYCKRNFKLCLICRQMYDINFKEDHEKEFHSQQQCKYCKSNIPSKQIQVHVQNCNSKPKMCDFCEQQVPKQLFIRHVEQCGARTQICPACNKNIVLKEYDSHFNQCWQTQIPKTEQSSRNSNSRTNNFNQNVYGSTSNSNVIPTNTISPGGTFGFYQPTGITTIPRTMFQPSNQYSVLSNVPYQNQYQGSNQRVQPRIIPPPQQNVYHPSPIPNNPLPSRSIVPNAQSIQQTNNPTNVSTRSQINHQPQNLQPKLNFQPNNSAEQSILNDDQNEMIQRAMMESLQNNRYRPQLSTSHKPNQFSYQPQQTQYPNPQTNQNMSHGQSSDQQYGGVGLTADTLNDKQLLEDIQMQEQIINSMKRTPAPNYLPGSLPRSNLGLPKW